jgi:hypothetical protein
VDTVLWSLAGLVFGVFLIYVGRRKRVIAGAERRCAACGYILRGINSELCPECGTPTAHAVHGELKRPWGTLIVGVIIAVASTVGIARHWQAPFHTKTWFHIAPTRALVWQQRRDPRSSYRVWEELVKRAAANKFSDAEVTLVFNAAVVDVKARTTPMASRNDPNPLPRDCLLQLLAVGRLDPARADAACDALIVYVSLAPMGGDEQSIDVHGGFGVGTTRATPPPRWLTATAQCVIDQQAVSVPEPTITESFPMSVSHDDRSFGTFPLKGAGTHTVELSYKFEFFAGPKDDVSNSRRLGSCTRSLTAHIFPASGPVGSGS